MPKARRHLDDIWRVFAPDTLATICELDETAFPNAYGLTKYDVAEQPHPNDWYAFRDNDSSVLAVAHLDTVSRSSKRRCRFLETAGGLVVYSRALDDRLGAYVILDLLPRLGITTDILLTVGEETGQSTARFFEPPKDYDWVIEFDRGGTDVVLYQYDDEATRELVEASGARVGVGTFSDIVELEHLGCKALNWGVGYKDYHTARSHAYLDDTFDMVSRFIDFHAANVGTHLPHYPTPQKLGTHHYLSDDLDRYEYDDDPQGEWRAWMAEQYAASRWIPEQ